jgi:hypothetical protein
VPVRWGISILLATRSTRRSISSSCWRRASRGGRTGPELIGDPAHAEGLTRVVAPGGGEEPAQLAGHRLGFVELLARAQREVEPLRAAGGAFTAYVATLPVTARA